MPICVRVFYPSLTQISKHRSIGLWKCWYEGQPKFCLILWNESTLRTIYTHTHTVIAFSSHACSVFISFTDIMSPSLPVETFLLCNWSGQCEWSRDGSKWNVHDTHTRHQWSVSGKTPGIGHYFQSKKLIWRLSQATPPCPFLLHSCFFSFFILSAANIISFVSVICHLIDRKHDSEWFYSRLFASSAFVGQTQTRADGSCDFYSHCCNLSDLAYCHFLHPASASLTVDGFPLLFKVMKYPHN